MNTDPIGDAVAQAYTITSLDQRRTVADEFDQGRTHNLNAYADLLQISSDALLLASLLEAEHPAVCNGAGRPKHNNFGKLLKEINAYKPVDNQ